nr:excisionase [uncultured Aminipila sp.]
MTEYQEVSFDTTPRIEALTIEKCAKVTKIGRDSIRQLINNPNSEFPYFKIGTEALIPVAALEQWMIKVSEERKCFC